MFPGSYGRGGDQGPLGYSLPAPGTFLPWFLQVAWNHLKGAKVSSVIFKIFFLLATSHFLPSIVGPKTAPFSLEGKEWTTYCCQHQRGTSEVPISGRGGGTWWGGELGFKVAAIAVAEFPTWLGKKPAAQRPVYKRKADLLRSNSTQKGSRGP